MRMSFDWSMRECYGSILSFEKRGDVEAENDELVIILLSFFGVWRFCLS